mgnify:CR=1 FL=1
MYSGLSLKADAPATAEPELRDIRRTISRGLRSRLALGSQVSIRTRHGQTLDVAWRMPLREGRALVVNVKIGLLLEARADGLYVVPNVSDHAHVEGAGANTVRWAPSGPTARAEWTKFTTRVEQVLSEIFQGGRP